MKMCEVLQHSRAVETPYSSKRSNRRINTGSPDGYAAR